MSGIIPYFRRNGNITGKDDWYGIERFFDDFFRDPFFERISAVTSPIRADIKETEKEYVVEAELPGVKKEDIVIDLNNDILTVGVDVKGGTDKEEDGYICKERHTGSYRRSFQVENIKNEEVKASYKDGLLAITLPKAEPGKRGTKRIQVQ